MKELLNERRSTEVEEVRDTDVVVGSGVTRMAADGSRSSDSEGDLLFVRSGSSSKRYRDTVAAGSGVTRRAADGSRSSETEGDLFFLSHVGVRRKGAEEDQRSSAKSRRHRREEEEWAKKTQEYVSALPLTSYVDQKMEAEDVENATHAGPFTCGITSVEKKALSSSKLRPLCQKKEMQPIR